MSSSSRRLQLLELQPLTRENWVAVASLSLLPGQREMLAPNIWSIAESHFEPHFVPRVIVVDDTVIGFLMYCPENDPPDPDLYWLFRFMLAEQFQGMGYGSRALELALREMEKKGARRVRTMHKQMNVAAAALYRKHDFAAIGVLDDGDIELELQIAPTS